MIIILKPDFLDLIMYIQVNKCCIFFQLNFVNFLNLKKEELSLFSGLFCGNLESRWFLCILYALFKRNVSWYSYYRFYMI